MDTLLHMGTDAGLKVDFRSLSLILTLGSVCFANTVLFGVEFGAIDKLAVTAKSPTSLSAAAVEALERLAEGKPESVPAEFADQMGLRPILGEWITYRQLPVRTYAIRNLGEVGTDDVVFYLSALKEEEFAPNIGERSQLGEAVQIALRSAQLTKIPETGEKVRWLEQLAADNTAAQGWAVDQLCDIGSLISYAVVQRSIRERFSGARIEEELSFCEQRIRLVRSNPDRTKALISGLNTDANQQSTRLVSWAANQLLSVGSPEAIQALKTFSQAVAGMPHESVWMTLGPIKSRIDEELRRKSAPN